MKDADLVKLNEFNVSTPGLICLVTDEQNNVIPIFNLTEFDPEKHQVALSQIWTVLQEQIVRKAIEDEMQNCFSDGTDIVDYQKVANLQSILIEWLDSKEDLSAGALND